MSLFTSFKFTEIWSPLNRFEHLLWSHFGNWSYISGGEVRRKESLFRWSWSRNMLNMVGLLKNFLQKRKATWSWKFMWTIGDFGRTEFVQMVTLAELEQIYSKITFGSLWFDIGECLIIECLRNYWSLRYKTW